MSEFACEITSVEILLALIIIVFPLYLQAALVGAATVTGKS